MQASLAKMMTVKIAKKTIQNAQNANTTRKQDQTPMENATPAQTKTAHSASETSKNALCVQRITERRKAWGPPPVSDVQTKIARCVRKITKSATSVPVDMAKMPPVIVHPALIHVVKIAARILLVAQRVGMTLKLVI